MVIISKNIDLGKTGESLAADYLVSQGMVVLERNWRISSGRKGGITGEIDLVVLDGNEVVIVEVKTRTAVVCGHPLESITQKKLLQLRQLAAQWARQAGVSGSLRIDAVSVLISDNSAPIFEHLKAVA